jgi:hypothetical protein
MDVIMMTTAMRRCLSHNLCSQPNPRNHHDNLDLILLLRRRRLLAANQQPKTPPTPASSFAFSSSVSTL